MGLEVTSRQPKGVKLGISKIANYNSRWILSLVSGEALLAALKAWKKTFDHFERYGM